MESAGNEQGGCRQWERQTPENNPWDLQSTPKSQVDLPRAPRAVLCLLVPPPPSVHGGLGGELTRPPGGGLDSTSGLPSANQRESKKEKTRQFEVEFEGACSLEPGGLRARVCPKLTLGLRQF